MTSSRSNLTPQTRLGAISFVNTIPVYGPYQPSPEVQLFYEAPAQLNRMMLDGQLDISPVSSACYLRNTDQLVLLEDLSVSSPGAVESVLFLSRVPLGPALLDHPAIYIPNDSETSVMLLAYLLHEATGVDFQPWFRTYEASEYRNILKNAGNALIIGDNALMMRESLTAEADPYYCYDLSSLWAEKTGLPFVFAVWVANRHWAEQHSETLNRIADDLREARQRFFTEIEVFNQGIRLAQKKSSLPAPTLHRYYRECLTYDLSPDHHTALTHFNAILKSATQWESTRLEQPLAP